MKKDFNLLGVVILFVVMLFSFNLKLDASKLTVVYPENLWFTRRGNNIPYNSGPFGLYDMDGEVVYCVEPGALVTSETYNLVDDGSSFYGEEIMKQIALISYYGYEYPGHDTVRYRMATQALIWATINGQIYEFWTEASGFGDYINIDYEKGVIMTLVESHYIKPSFSDSEINGYLYKEIKLEDTNNVLDNYSVLDDGGNVIRKDGNILYIIPNKTGTSEITFIKNKYDNKTTKLYIGSDSESQKVALLRTDDLTFKITLNTESGSLKVKKKGEESKLTDKGYVYNKINLENVKIGVYANNDIVDFLGNVIYSKDSLVYTLVTDKDGNASMSSMYYGDYYLKEIETVNNHVLDDKIYPFTLNENEIQYEITLDNYLPKGSLEFTKTDFIESKALPNTLISVYNIDDELIFSGRTDSEGKIVIESLPIGKYYIIESEAPEGYLVNNEKLYFEIKENNEIVKCKMKDELIVNVPDTHLDKNKVSYFVNKYNVFLGEFYEKKKYYI